MKTKTFFLSVLPTLISLPLLGQESEAMDQDWLTTVQSNIAQLEYSFADYSDDVCDIRLHNRANDYHATLSASEFTIHPKSDVEDVNFKVMGVESGTTRYTSDLVGYERPSGNEIRFWTSHFKVEFVNTEEGLRQNFILDEPLSNADDLKVILAVEGADLQLIGDKEVSIKQANQRVMSYSDLKVWDAEGNLLKAFMTANGQHIELHVEGTSDAIYPLTIDPIVTSTVDRQLEENQADANFGLSVSTAGDVNGDGYSDVIVGAYQYNNGENNEGAAFIYHGSASGVSPTAAVHLEINQVDAIFGTSVSTAGDVNGDGYSDVIVGASGCDNGENNEGAVFIYHGSASGISSTVAVQLEENQANASYGASVSTAGDVNGDGYSDVIVGASAYTNGEAFEGTAYVYHGSASGVSSTAAVQLEENGIGAFMGESVSSAGDVNGDGYSDVIVGAAQYENGQTDEGAAFVYHGSASGISSVAAAHLEDNVASVDFGNSVSSAGDVNGDGYSDVIVGVRNYTNGESHEGAIYVYHGSALGISTTSAFQVESNQSNSHFGYSVSSAGDVNGDGYSDVIVGVVEYNNGQNDEGAAFIYHGSASGLVSTVAAFLEGNQTSGNFGFSVSSAGDVNGDGYSDVIVGAYRYDNGENNEGAAFIYHGGASSVSTTAALQLEGNQVAAALGWSVSSAGDVNGDGFSDVIVGAQHYENGQSIEGVAFVYHGSVNGISSIPATTLEEDVAGARFGGSVSSAGDVNGDGYGDVIVGAPFYTNDLSTEGAMYIYHGSASGLSSTAATLLEGNQLGSRFGFSVSSAGDVNGDGYGDVIVGAWAFDNGESNEGVAYIYHGGPTGIVSEVPYLTEGDQLGAAFGYSVSSAGDVNGDGYSDVIIGAYRYDNGESLEGVAFVHHGSPDGISSTAAALLQSNQVNAFFGWSVSSAGDVNGDGFSDVIVGAFQYDNGENNEGAVFVYHGSASGVSTTATTLLESDQADADFGHSVSLAGDVNGDGYSDVIVGAAEYSNGESAEGAAFVYHGSASGISTTASFQVESDQASAEMGTSVSSAGDVNGDGFADVIVGAPSFDNGENDEGIARVYHGNSGTGLRNYTIIEDSDGSTLWGGVSSLADGNFKVGLFSKSPMGRVKGAVQIEVVSQGESFGSGTIVNGTLTDLGLLGMELTEDVPYNDSIRTKFRVRPVFDLVTAIDGRRYGPWRIPIEAPEGLPGGDAILWDGSSWHKGSGTAGAPSTSDDNRRLLIHGTGATISENAEVRSLVISEGSGLSIDVDRCLTVSEGAGNNGTFTISGNTSGKHGSYIGPSIENAKVEMGISGAGWHNVSVPVDITFSAWSDENTAGSINLSGSSSSQNVYTYNTTLSAGAQSGHSVGSYSSHSYGTFELPGSSDDVMGAGLNLYLDANFNGAPQVISATGTTRSDNMVVPLYSAYGGWNLVGNPFPGSIDLNALYTDNSSEINPGVYIWDPGSSNYVAIDASTGTTINADLGVNSNGQVISTGQSFYVRPTDYVNSTVLIGVTDLSTTKSLTLSQSQMICGTPVLYKSSFPTVMVEAGFDGFSTGDELAVVFAPSFTDGFQHGEDIEKLFSSGSTQAPNFFVTDNGVAMGIAKYQTLLDSTRIPLGLGAEVNGPMYIRVNEVPLGWDVYLKDYQEGTLTRINDQEYSFYQDSLFGPDRFELILSTSGISIEESTSGSNWIVFQSEEGLILSDNNLTGRYEVSVSDLSGRALFRTEQSFANGEMKLAMDLPSGMYVVSMMNVRTNEVHSQRIIWR